MKDLSKRLQLIMPADTGWRVDAGVIAILCLLAFLPRIVMLMFTQYRVDADEAIVGLMALHITKGMPWPIYYYGQAYMGSLEAFLAAASFLLFGVSSFGLKLVPLVFAMIHVGLVYIFTRMITCSRLTAMCAGILVAFAPSALIEWSTRARGGFIELVVLGTLSLVIAFRVVMLVCPLSEYSAFLKPGYRRKRIAGSIYCGLCGFFLGLGWWVNNQAVFYLLTVAIFLGVYYLKALFRDFLPVAQLLRAVIYGLIGFVIGALPFFWFNLGQRPRLQTLRAISGHASLEETWAHFYGLLTESIPILLGSRRFWSDEDLLPSLSLALGVVFTGVILINIWVAVSGPATRIKRGAQLCLIFFIVTTVIFSFSSFGWLTKAPRYLLPLYSVFPVLTVIAVRWLLGTGVSYQDMDEFETTSPLILIDSSAIEETSLNGSFSISGWRVFLGLGLYLFHLVLGLLSNYQGLKVYVPGEPVIYPGDRVAQNQMPLYAWLERHSYQHIRTNYWIGYRAAFETQERVTFTRFMEPRSLRIPSYELANLDLLKESPYVLGRNQSRRVIQELHQAGISFTKTMVGEYVVIHDLRRNRVRDRQFALEPQMLSSKYRPEWLGRLIDGKLGTRWGSGAPQNPQMEIAVSFPRPVELSALELDFGFWRQDFPRGLIIEGLMDEGGACELFRSEGVPAIFEDSREWLITFKPVTVKGLVLRQTGQDQVFDWSLAELRVYEVARDLDR